MSTIIYLDQPGLENLFLGFMMPRIQFDCKFLINVFLISWVGGLGTCIPSSNETNIIKFVILECFMLQLKATNYLNY